MRVHSVVHRVVGLGGIKQLYSKVLRTRFRMRRTPHTILPTSDNINIDARALYCKTRGRQSLTAK